MLPGSDHTGRRLAKNPAELGEYPGTKRPNHCAWREPARRSAPQVRDLAADHHQQPIGGEQQAISKEAGGLDTARWLLDQRSG